MRAAIRSLFRVCVSLLLSGAFATSVLAAEPYTSAIGPCEVRTLNETWHDGTRDRDIPVRLYLPERASVRGNEKQASPAADTDAGAPGLSPVVVFSPGLGGSRNHYGSFCTHLARAGYVVVIVTHAGSDTEAMLREARARRGGRGGVDRPATEDRAAPGKVGDEGEDAAGSGSGALGERGEGAEILKDMINDPESLRNRPRDISFVIGEVSRNPATRDVADSSRIAVAGHSFGAHTSMCLAGTIVDLPDSPDTSFRDERVKAVVAMSPQGPGVMGLEEDAWREFAVPVLFLTGTRDYGVGERSAAWRRAAFDAVRGGDAGGDTNRPDAFLVTINDAGHMTFGASGPEERKQRGGRFRERVRERMRERRGEAPDLNQAAHTALIQSLSLAFLDAYLRDDSQASAWLTSFFDAQHNDCVAEASR